MLTDEEFAVAKAHYEADHRSIGRPFECLDDFLQIAWLCSAKGITPKLEEKQ